MPTKKLFFKERTPAQIKRLNLVHVGNIAELVQAHAEHLGDPDFAVQVATPVFPERTGAITYNKYGPITRLRTFYSIGEAIEAKIHPYELLREAVNSMEEPTLGFAIEPPIYDLEGRVIRGAKPLVVPWKEPIEGARVFAYSKQENVPIELNVKGTNNAYEGVTLDGKVPSRRKGIPRWKQNIKHVPAVALRDFLSEKIKGMQFYIPLTIDPLISSEKAKYYQMRFGMPGLRKDAITPGMWLDVALYLEYASRDIKRTREYLSSNSNAKPFFPPAMEFTPFPMTTKFLANMYKKFRNNTLNYKGEKLRDAETNLSIGETARQFKHGRTFFSQRAKDGKVSDYNWAIGEPA